MKSNLLEKYTEYLNDENAERPHNLMFVTKIIDEVIDEVIDEHTHTKANITDFPTVASKTADGLCPQLPDETATTKYLRQDGTWTEPNAEYTFIIDSDERLADWANNAANNDYSRILIKENKNDNDRGWVLTSELSGGSSSSPNAVIDISDGRTKSVVGESGSKIVINNSQSSTYLVGIKGKVTGTYPNFTNPGKEYFFRNVTIEINCTVSGSYGYGYGYGFHSCTNLTNCTGTGSSGSGSYGFQSCTNLTNCTGSSGGGSSYGYGFQSCTNLTNCTGTGTGGGGGFHSCTNLTNCTGSGGSYGFQSCTNLTNCTGTGNYGFYSCRIGFGCRGTHNGCYMAQSGTTNPWGTNADGGYNFTS